MGMVGARLKLCCAWLGGAGLDGGFPCVFAGMCSKSCTLQPSFRRCCLLFGCLYSWERLLWKSRATSKPVIMELVMQPWICSLRSGGTAEEMNEWTYGAVAGADTGAGRLYFHKALKCLFGYVLKAPCPYGI